MLAVIFFGVVVALLFYVSSLSGRIEKLEADVASLRADHSSTTVESARSVENAVSAPATPKQYSPLPPPDSASSVVATTSAVNQFSPHTPHTQAPSEFFVYTWFKDEPLIKIGGLLFFFGMVWFVSYAVNQAWLPAAAQIFLAYLLALVAYGSGWLRSKAVHTQYLVLTCLGTGIVFAATFAAQFVYELFAPAVALFILVISIMYTVAVSIRTQTQWLAVVAAVAGMGAPLLVNSPTPDYMLLLSYLFALTAGFMTVVAVTTWRAITSVLMLGIVLFLTSLIDVAAAPLLWSFVIAFSVLFFVSITTSVVRTRMVHTSDVVHIGVTGLLFIMFADILAINPAFATSAGAAVVAAVAVVTYIEAHSNQVITLFSATAVALGLVATGHIFSGDMLVAVYAIQISAAFWLLTYLQVSERMQIVAASLYAIPIVASAESLFGSYWESGIPFAAAFSTGVMVAVLWATTVWLFERSLLISTAIGSNLAVAFTVVSYFYSVVLLERWAVALTSGLAGATGNILTYILWSVLSLLLVHYFMQRKSDAGWITASLSTLLIPVLASLPSLSLARWDGIWHFDAIGAYFILAILATTTTLLTLRYRLGGDADLRRHVMVLAVSTLVYAYVVLALFWHGVFGYGDSSFAALYSSYALIAYGIFSFLIIAEVSWQWVQKSMLLYFLPAAMALYALFVSGSWESIWHPHLVGVFVVTALLAVAVIRLNHWSQLTAEVAAEISQWQRILGGIGFVLAIGMVWRITHSVVPSADIAVVVALFIYTVTGLGLYITGRSHASRALRISGILLLALVVARLVLVDVWSMETLPRIATFLGIGFLFMVTALLEKPFAKQSKESTE